MFKVYNGETTKEELELRKVCTKGLSPTLESPAAQEIS